MITSSPLLGLIKGSRGASVRSRWVFEPIQYQSHSILLPRVLILDSVDNGIINLQIYLSIHLFNYLTLAFLLNLYFILLILLLLLFIRMT